MQGPYFRSATWLLVVAIIAMMGMTTSGAVAHEVKHAAHHSAASHSTGICAWMCATGAVAHQAPLYLAYSLGFVGLALILYGNPIRYFSASRLNSRAPPLPTA